MQIKCANPEQVAKRAFYLAYNASSVIGMGVFQARPNVTEDMVWEHLSKYNPNKPSADYVYGRMMKLRIGYDKESITVNDYPATSDYQSWCHKYPTYEDLIQAAINELRSTT